MWKIIYNILINIALPFFIVLSIFKRKLRKNLSERLFGSTRGQPLKDAIWIHAASIGEAVIGETLINFFKKYRGFDNFLITTNTFYTSDLLKKKFGHKVHVYSLPLDLTYVIDHFIDGSTFNALILVETEIWPNLIWSAKKHKIPVIILNGRISDRTLPNYKRFSFFLKNVLSDIDTVIAQSEEHRKRYISIGTSPNKVVVTGNIKYYRDISNTSDAVEKDDILTFGSIKEKEMPVVLSVIDRIKDAIPGLIIYIAPRELHLAGIIENELSEKYRTIRYSGIKQGIEKRPDIIIVDTVGDLLSIYEKSKLAFVGGSLAPYGGQNMLEPLFFKTPVVFGPFTENFKEIAELIIKNDAGIVVNNADELYDCIKNLLQDDKKIKEMGEKGKTIIETQSEHMEKTVDIIMQTIKKGSG